MNIVHQIHQHLFVKENKSLYTITEYHEVSEQILLSDSLNLGAI